MEQSIDSLKVNHNDSEESETDSQVFELGIQLGTFFHSKGKQIVLYLTYSRILTFNFP